MPTQNTNSDIKILQKELEEKKHKKLQDELAVINKRLMDRADAIVASRKYHIQVKGSVRDIEKTS